jgi:hypothetical protein
LLRLTFESNQLAALLFGFLPQFLRFVAKRLLLLC